MDGQYWKDDRTMSTNEWLLTSDFWQFLEPWHGRWYEYEIFIASCTDNIYDLENERWLLGDMIDHVGIYGSKVAEGLSAFNAGLVRVYSPLACRSWQHMKYSHNVVLPSYQLKVPSPEDVYVFIIFDQYNLKGLYYKDAFSTSTF